MNLNILFVSHEASPTGAPLFLLHFAQWLKQYVPGISMATIFIKDGPLHDSWRELGPTISVEGLQDRELMSEIKLFYKQHGKFDAAYFNTIESSHMLALFTEQDWFGSSVHSILHIHELEGTIQKYGADRVRKVRHMAGNIIAVSKAVKKNLVEKHGFDQDHIQIIYPCARDLSQLVTRKIKHEKSDQRVVLGCGEVTVVKGTDLFIQVCKKITKEFVSTWPLVFQWLGANSHGILSYLKNDLRKLNLEEKLFFPGHQQDIGPWFSHADIFFLSSREDSCPLVCLEAASLGLPIVYFEQSGGMDEVLGEQAGFPVPYMDIDAAAATIIHLLQNPEEAAERGNCARQLYQLYHMPNLVYSSLFNQINQSITRKEECLV